MSTIFGSVNVEKYKYDVLETKGNVEIRKYLQAVQVCVKMEDGEKEGKSKSKAFPQLAKYIGVFNTPENKSVKKEDSTSEQPVKIAMTAPVVITDAEEAKGTKIAMTAPVVTAEGSSANTSYQYMSFILPSQYQKMSDCPEPTNPNVWLEELPSKYCAVLPFKGRACPQEQQKGEELIKVLDGEGIKFDKNWRLAQFNPPWCLPFLRYNEIIVDLEDYKASGEPSASETAASETPANETAANETAANETAASETAANETAANETAANETAVNETAANETAANETAANETPANETPANETAANETPANETSANETPASDTAANETPANETPASETSANETPASETSANETAANETAASDTAANETAANETAANETAANETPASETSANETPASQ